MPKKKNPSTALALPELPEDIQRRIVISLPPKAFARSSVLSKSWLSFYNSTRYSFHLSLPYKINTDFGKLHQEIMNFDKHFSDSLLREKLTVEVFNIDSDYIVHFNTHYQLRDIVYKWLAALSTTNNIIKVLRIRIPTSAVSKLYMPPEIFSNESLQVLHLLPNLPYCCILDQVHSINFGCLRVLSLRNIDAKSTNRFLTASLILEQLTLSLTSPTHFETQHIIINGLHKLKGIDIYGFADVRILEAPALENVSLMFANDQYDGRLIINSQACRRIKRLELTANSKRTATHIQQIVSYLPALENLKLYMYCATDITISSLCLKNLGFYICEDQDLKMVKINAPNLRCYEYGSNVATFSRQIMMKTGMLEMAVIDLAFIEIDDPLQVLELRKAFRMIEHLKLGVDTVKLVSSIFCIKASRFDEKLNVSASRVIEMLDAGAMKFDVDGKLCF